MRFLKFSETQREYSLERDAEASHEATSRRTRAPKAQCPGTDARAFQPRRNRRRRPEQPKRKQIPRNKEKPKETGRIQISAGITRTWRQTLIQKRSSTVMCRPGFSSSQGHGGKVARCIEEEESTDDRTLTDPPGRLHSRRCVGDCSPSGTKAPAATTIRSMANH